MGEIQITRDDDGDDGDGWDEKSRIVQYQVVGQGQDPHVHIVIADLGGLDLAERQLLEGALHLTATMRWVRLRFVVVVCMCVCVRASV